MRFAADTRGQAIAIGRALAGLFMIGLLWALAKPAFDKMRAAGKTHITNQTATTGQQYVGWLFDEFLIIALGITIIGMTVVAVFQRRGGP